MRDKILMFLGLVLMLIGVIVFISGIVLSNSTIIWIGYGFEIVSLVILCIYGCLNVSGTSVMNDSGISDEDLGLISTILFNIMR